MSIIKLLGCPVVGLLDRFSDINLISFKQRGMHQIQQIENQIILNISIIINWLDMTMAE